MDGQAQVSPGPEHQSEHPAPRHRAEEGTPLGAGFLIHEVVGVGATGAVHRGTRRAGGGPVAIKVLRPELARDPEVVARFIQERTILVSLRHPNLVGVHDLVAEGGVVAIVMEFVGGGDLRDLLRREGRLAPGLAGELVAQVLDAMAAAHAQGVAHRDLKPENVLLERADPARPVARVTDFGIARIAHGPSFTRLSGVVGTPDYMAPEQAEGAKPTPAVDVYAAGVLAYELMTGTTPFPDRHPMAVLRAHIDEAPSRPDGLPDAVWAVLSRMLAKAPGDRPAAGEAAAALRSASRGLTDLLPAPAAGPQAGTPTRVSAAGQPMQPPGAPSSSAGGSADAAVTRLRLDRAQPPAAAPTPRPAWFGRGLAAAVAALVLIAVSVVAAVLGSGGRQPVASYAFPPVQYADGVVSSRVWTITGGHAFQGTVGLTNGGPTAVTATVQEAIPDAIAPSAGDLTFRPPPAEIVQADPVVAYEVSLAPHTSFQFRYAATVAPREGTVARLSARLKEWAGEGATETVVPEQGLPPPATLVAISANPPAELLVPGQAASLAVTGTMSDGSAAPGAALTGLVWASSDPAVVTVSAGSLTARSPGTATVTARAGSVVAAVPVVVSPGPQAATPPKVAPGAKASQPASSPQAPSPPAPPPPSSAPAPSPMPTTTRVPIFQAYKTSSYDWFYTSSASELSQAEKTYGYSTASIQEIAFYGCRTYGSVYVWRLFNPKSQTHLFTADGAEEAFAISTYGFTPEAPNFEACNPQIVPGVVPVYRLTYKGAFFLTVSANTVSQVEKLGWTYQGLAFYAFPPPGYTG